MNYDTICMDILTLNKDFPSMRLLMDFLLYRDFEHRKKLG